MKKSAKLILLIILFIAMVVVIILIPKDTDKKNETEIKQADGDPLQINGNDNPNTEEEGELICGYIPLSSLKWINSENEVFDFKKVSYNWVKTDDETFSISDTFVNEMLDSIEEIYSTRTIENVDNLSEYGLDNPKLTLTIDNDTTIKIGDPVPTTDSYYFSNGDGNVYLISQRILTAFSHSIDQIYYPIDISENSISDNNVSANNSISDENE